MLKFTGIDLDVFFNFSKIKNSVLLFHYKITVKNDFEI